MRRCLLLIAICSQIICNHSRAVAATLHFANYEWTVQTGHYGPGPNYWDAKNAWVDGDGALHVKITERDGKWYCAELTTTNRLGFGRYDFDVVGRLDQFDQNIVLGLFNYPTKDVGVDGTNEIDMEFSHWGNPKADIGNFTIWPPIKGVKQSSKRFPFTLNGNFTTHRFTWSANNIRFQSLHGHRTDDASAIQDWTYQPDEPAKHIPQNPMPLHINLWLFRGQAPHDGKPVEIVIRSFTFTPEEKLGK